MFTSGFLRFTGIASLVYWSIMLMGTTPLHAQQDPVLITVLEGKDGGIHKDSARETIDLVYYSPLVDSIVNPANDRYTNSISLYVNENFPLMPESDFKVDLLLTLFWTDMNGQQDSLGGKELSIQYKMGQDSLSRLRTYFRMDSCRKLKIRIDSVNLNGCTWDATRMLVLENRMEVQREYVFDCSNTITTLSHQIGPLSASMNFDKLIVSWTPSTAPGTTHYDLEWAWIDYAAQDFYKSGSSFSAQLIFPNNSSRVTLPANQSSFEIPMLYDGEGLLFYRVRPIKIDAKDQVYAGVWTGIPDHYYHYETGHEPSLNWQVSTSFAEEGKHKTVIQYFDGTLRNRQSVTKDNDTKTTVIAETLYDYQGRPAINILPAPTLNEVIEYAHNFNRFTTDVYPKDLYDLLPISDPRCAVVTPPLDSISGASHYYSSNNLLVNNLIGNQHSYIPSAFGYPYSETLYTPDATGRLTAQGGVGPEYQINSNHETKYFYGSPDQKELNALFGTEVGDASHYFKNMVRDANGQYSVSYVDMRGRTIATALAGPIPDSVQGLPGYQTRYFTRNLLQDGNNQVKDRSVESSTTLLVTREGLHEFYYELSPQSAMIQACNPPGEPVCYDCYYDLEIRISSDCLEEPILITRKNFSFGEYDPSCAEAAPSLIVDTSFVMTEGEYNITKTLRLSKDAQDWYRENVFAINNICSTLVDFYNEQYQILVDANNCILECNECKAELGTYAEFRASFLTNQGLDPQSEVPYEAEIKASYDQALAECELLCEPVVENKLKMIRDLMLWDMIPDQGQYALRDIDLNGNGVIDDNLILTNDEGVKVTERNTNKPYNIFNRKAPQNLHPTSGQNYNNLVPVFANPYHPVEDALNYFDANGLAESGLPPRNVLSNYSPEQFMQLFKDSWANSLIFYHPEYDRLKYAEENLGDSYDWDAVLENTHTWDEALAAGFISNNILNLDPFLGGPLGENKTRQDNGSWFPLISYRNKMSLYLSEEYRNYGKTIWQLAWATVNCKENDIACINSIGPYPPYSASQCTGDMDAVWRIFRSIYLAEKERFIAELIKNNVKNAARDNALKNSAYGYQPRFVDYSADDGFFTQFNVFLNGNGSAAADEANSQWEEAETATCNGYRDMWENKLLQCDAIRNSPYREEIIRKMLSGLVDVCIRGADWEHPNGSSTVSPGDDGVPPTSFEQVIRTILAEYSIPESEFCNPYLIDYPQPYDRQFGEANPSVIDAKDDCMCGRLQELETNKTQSAFNGNLSQYIEARHGINIRQSFLDSLIAGCSDANDCNIYDPALEIPAILDCETSLNNCIDCQEYTTLKSEFHNLYPAHAGSFYANPDEDSELVSNQFLSQFLNYRTGFSYNWHDYLDFEMQCTDYEVDWDCDSLQQILTLYWQNGGDTVSAANCNTAFTQFFNTQAGTSYTFAQIQSLFLAHCGIIPDICAPTLNCAGFQQVIDNFYNTYGHIIRNDVACDSLFTEFFNNQLGTSYTYAELQDLFQRVCGGVLDVCAGLDCDRLINILEAWKSCNPVIFLSTGCDTLWTNYFNAQIGGSYSFQQIDSIYAQCNIELNPCQVQADCRVLRKLLIAYGNADSLACAPANLNPADTSYCSDCFTWYINDKLGTSYSYAQLYQLYLEQCGTVLQVCGPSFRCKDLTLLVNQFTQWQMANPGAEPCDSLFTVQFNQYFHLNYTYDQIVRVYKKFCGKTIEFCVPEPPLSCVQLSDIRSAFLQLYPDPSRYFGDSCQQVFTKFFNAVAGDTLSYDEIRMRYLLVCETDLDICQPDSCGRTQELLTRFNDQFGSYKFPQALARDLFTAVFNQTVQPVQPYHWKDIVRLFLTDSCELELPLFPADSTYPLTCENLQGAMRAFSTLYGSANPQDCEKLFAGMLNTYFGTSFTDIAQVRGWAADNCVELPVKICGGEPEPVKLVLRATAVPVTTVLPPQLCGSTIIPSVVQEEEEPCDYLQTVALHIATEKYQLYVQQQYENFDSTYRDKCLNLDNQEVFTVRAQAAEYHYTLYYYDQAGNLVKTVPPAGVDMSEMASEAAYEQWHSDVQTARANQLVLTPDHVLKTEYRYNSLNQVVAQKSPDGGTSQFWYDRLGRLVISRNANQLSAGKYSYTKYDPLGRIAEVGQIAGTGVDQTLTRDQASLNSWHVANANSREQITNTYYDVQAPGLCDPPLICQTHLRNRVSFSTLTDLATDADYASGSFYSYDIHGNVNVLVQHYFKGMLHDEPGHAFKKITYKYDLISGKVNEVAYQPGLRDQFYHRYQYDASNRLTEVYTSHDKLYWERQATYSYYRHGPLARMELGQLRVQGLDYAYTLQGWLKGVNSAAIGGSFDMGGDGANIERAATDVYAFQLQYNQRDYKAISHGRYPFAIAHYLESQSDALRTGQGLFNGNISSMLVNIPQLGEAHLYGYAYDQLNRIVGMNAYTGLNGSNGELAPAATTSNAYRERVSYDGNGNILSYLRNGEAGDVAMDDLTYHYDETSGRLNHNQLQYVTDAVTANTGNTADIKTQASGYYAYDAIGNLVREGLTSGEHQLIEWNVYGKIRQITRKNGSTQLSLILYTYDVSGNRIGKKVQTGSGTPVESWYVRDASGNVMAIYEKENPAVNNGELSQIEVPLYGSSRLGLWRPMRALEGENWELFDTDPAPGTGGIREEEFVRGRTQYELSNHLGNVLVTISDNRVPVDDGTYEALLACPTCLPGYPCIPCHYVYVKTNAATDGVVDRYTAVVITANDYYPFGMLMPGRKYSADGSYRYGFNGKEKDTDINSLTAYDYGFRIYNPALGRFLSVDPLTGSYPWYTPYQFAGNKPIFAVDLDGLEERPSIYDKYKEVLTGSPKVTKFKSVPIDQTSTSQSQSKVLTEVTTESGFAQKMLAQKYGRNGLERSHYAIYKANRERESEEAVVEFMKMTDINDAVVLATMITRDKPIQIDGTEADEVDQGFAVAGIFIPFVSGSLVKRAASPLMKGSIKVFRSGLEKIEDAVKIGKYGFKGTKQWNQIVRAVQGGGNIVANSKEEALKFLKEAFPDMLDESNKAASRYGYRIDDFKEEAKEGLKQGHQGWHINYYDKENNIYGTLLVDKP